MAKYEEMFEDACWFTDGTYVIGGWYSREEAAERFSNDLGRPIDPEDIYEERVRFGFPPENCEDCDHKNGPLWYNGACGRGSKIVWAVKV